MPAPYTCPVLSFTTKTNKVDLVDASHINALQTETAAINNRLLNAIDSDGTILSGSSFPSPIAGVSQQFWRTDLNVLYVWTGSQWSPQSGITSYTAGDYLLNNVAVGVIGSYDYRTSTTYAKVAEIYVQRSGTLRVKFYLAGNGGGASIGYGRIYRNGSAVGTEQSNNTTATEYSEDISGWSAGDLLQLYYKSDPAGGGTSAACGGLRIYTGVPTIETPVSTYEGSIIWLGDAGAPFSGVGNIGDIHINRSGGASTTLYIKTGASTWTAK